MKRAFVCLLLMLGSCERRSAPQNASAVPPGVSFAPPFSWVYKATPEQERYILDFILRFECVSIPNPSKPEVRSDFLGTGFLLRGGFAVTNYHVAADCPSPREISARSATGGEVRFIDVQGDKGLDIAIFTTIETTDGLEIGTEDDLSSGQELYSWGFLADYPSPLRTTGTLAGFAIVAAGNVGVKSIVINGAINKGNSGSPIFALGSSKVVGIATSKYTATPPLVNQALNALSKNASGFSYNYVDEKNRTTRISEAQVTSVIHGFLLQQIQLVIGNGIAASVLHDYLAFVNRRRVLACVRGQPPPSPPKPTTQAVAQGQPSKNSLGTR